MNPAMVETAFRCGIRVHAGRAIRPAVLSASLRIGALAAATTTKKFGKTTR
jgi:hypothetical protein